MYMYYNENELDQTDYPYTYFSEEDILSPKFFIGRWSIGSEENLQNIIFRNFNYLFNIWRSLYT